MKATVQRTLGDVANGVRFWTDGRVVEGRVIRQCDTGTLVTVGGVERTLDHTMKVRILYAPEEP